MSEKRERIDAAITELQNAVSDYLADCTDEVTVCSDWTPVHTIGLPTKWVLDLNIYATYNTYPGNVKDY